MVHGVAPYRGALRRAVVDYKYRRRVEHGAWLAGLLARFVVANPTWFEEYDLLTAVPAYCGPGARRDWDPVGRLLGELGQRLGPGWEVRTDLVVKVTETPAMNGLSRWERGRLAEGPLRAALRPGPVGLSGARVLVVDDVFTEGSTLREVARVLRAAGAEEVAGLVVARPAWSGDRPVRRGS